MTFSLSQQVDLKTNLPKRVEELGEGTYQGTVTKAGTKTIETKNGPATLFEITIKIEDQTFNITYWLTSEPNLKRCLTSLKRIGFKVDEWGPNFGRPYLDELEDAAEKLKNGTLSFKRGTSGQGYPTIGLETFQESHQVDPSLDADLPF